MKASNSLCLIYFSGTGNTKLAALTIADHFRKNGFHVDLRSVEKNDFADGLENFDLIGFGFPVYAWRAPDYFMRRLREYLPQTHQKPAFIFNTRAIASWRANHYAAREIAQKGIVFLGGVNLTAPPNDWMVLFHQDNPLVQRYVKFGELFFYHIERFCGKVENRFQRFLDGEFRYRWSSMRGNPLGVIASTVGNVLGKMLFTMIARKWSVAMDLCINCGFCSRTCPSGNIEMAVSEGDKIYPHWNDRCIYCFRCINYCPTGAILLTRWARGKYRYRLDIDIDGDGK